MCMYKSDCRRILQTIPKQGQPKFEETSTLLAPTQSRSSAFGLNAVISNDGDERITITSLQNRVPILLAATSSSRAFTSEEQ